MFARIRLGISVVCILAAVVQVIFFLDFPNLVCIALCLALTIGGNKLLGRPEYIQEYPISTLTALMFSFSTFTLPLVMSAIEWRPITRNLILPIETMSYLALMGVTIFLAHSIYRRSAVFQKTREFVTWKINDRIGVFKSPTAAQLWIMGFIGVACFYYKAMVLVDKGSAGDAGVFVKVIVGLSTLAYAPMLIPLNKLFTSKPWPVKPKFAIPLLLYFGLVVGAALLRNDRSDFAMAPVIMLVGLVIGLLSQRIRIKRINWQTILPAIAVVVFVYPMLSDLAVAMIIVRKEYGKTGAREQVDLTIDMYARRDELRHTLEMMEETSTRKYDFSYYDSGSVFLDRFANLRMHDLVLDQMSRYDEGDYRDLAQFSLGNALSGFPDPVLALFGIEIDKKEYMTSSIGDYMYYEDSGGGLGGFRIGSMLGHGVALFGPFFFPLFGISMLLFFTAIDSFSYRKRISIASIRSFDWKYRLEPVYSLPLFAPVFLLNSFAIINPYRAGSAAEIPLFILRYIPEYVITYLVVFFFTSRVSLLYRFLVGGNKHIQVEGPRSLPV